MKFLCWFLESMGMTHFRCSSTKVIYMLDCIGTIIYWDGVILRIAHYDNSRGIAPPIVMPF